MQKKQKEYFPFYCFVIPAICVLSSEALAKEEAD